MITSRNPLSVLVFSCEGREHLLRATLDSIELVRLKIPLRVLLSVDGNLNLQKVSLSGISLAILHRQRIGYIKSIISSLDYVTEEFFLWLEDDWAFGSISEKQIRSAVDVLKADRSILQVRWPKDNSSAGQPIIASGIVRSKQAFSANPSIIRTSAAKDVFKMIEEIITVEPAGNANIGFEEFVCEWAMQKGFYSAVFDVEKHGTVEHLGYLESTDRKWHFVGIADPRSSPNKPGIHNINWLSLMPKFILKCFRIIAAMPFSERAAELAFRFVSTK
jgi:hypothetical protein